MPEAFICDGVRTPIGRYGGSLSKVRTDDLAAVPIKALMKRHANVDWEAVDDVIFGCTDALGPQAGDIARTSWLVAGFPEEVPACCPWGWVREGQRPRWGEDRRRR